MTGRNGKPGNTANDNFNLADLTLKPDMVPERRITPHKIAKRREKFVQVPWTWIEALSGASGQTWHLAMHLLYLHWKGNGAPIKLANGMLEQDGISRASKWRALTDLEHRHLITIGHRPGKSPMVTLRLPSQI